VSAFRMARYLVGPVVSSPSFRNRSSGVFGEPYSRQMALSGVKPPWSGN
jgi:hypothetical protein